MSVTEEVTSTVLFLRALRVGGLALPGQGIQQQALRVAGSGVTLWELHSKIGLAGSLGRLLAVRERRVIGMHVQALGAKIILVTADETCTYVAAPQHAHAHAHAHAHTQ